MKIENKILLSRLMTRSGDQAWDFAVPLVLMNIFPQHMRFAFFYFFSIKLSSILLMPLIGKHIDKKTRRTSLVWGIGTQALGVVCSTAAIYLLSKFSASETNSPLFLTLFGMLIFSGILSTLGTNVMDIAVSNDLVPTVVNSERLPIFNSRLRQLDLLTEVLSPVAAGGLLLVSIPTIPLLGIILVALWNLVTFLPEYQLLNVILKNDPSLNQKQFVSEGLKLNLWQKIQIGWDNFTKLSVSSSIITYSILWLSVLSPHGVLLTAFLKGGWQLSEPVIGTFRGLGAVLGLVATLIYPIYRKKHSVVETSKRLLLFQAAMVTAALYFFFQKSNMSQLIFLGAVLASRIGLYGFSLGEIELRQRLIPESLRGEVNGVASALNSLATLFIFCMGLIFSTPDSFKYLVIISVLAVVLASVLFATLVSDRLKNHLAKNN